MKRFVALLAFILFLLPSIAAAQSCVSAPLWQVTGNTNLYVARYECTTAANGALTNEVPTGTNYLDGFVTDVVISPKSPTPSNNFSVTIKDQFGTSIMGQVLSNCSASTGTRFQHVNGFYPGVHGMPRISVSNQTTANAAITIRFYVLRMN